VFSSVVQLICSLKYCSKKCWCENSLFYIYKYIYRIMPLYYMHEKNGIHSILIEHLNWTELGRWTIDNGQLTIHNGQFTMDSVSSWWMMDDGGWTMVDGWWLMGHTPSTWTTKSTIRRGIATIRRVNRGHSRRCEPHFARYHIAEIQKHTHP